MDEQVTTGHLSERVVRRLPVACFQRGQDVVEYGLIIATVALVVLVGVTAFGAEIEPWFAQLAGLIATVGT